jgi:hypothetical protein
MVPPFPRGDLPRAGSGHGNAAHHTRPTIIAISGLWWEMLEKTSDGSFVSEEGKILYFSCERFVRDICEGNCCFLCGASPDTVSFNNEHVLADWILRRYGISGRRIILPNGTSIRYDQYKVPCCAKCNTEMGRRIEKPVSQLICGGQDAVHRHIKEHGALLFIVWLGLIFLKTHLKDRHLRLSRDLRNSSDPISSLYEWEDLHHVHTLVRCFYTGSEIDHKVLGSFLMLPVHESNEERFDYGDLYKAQTAFMRLDDFAFVTVFNDSCGAFTKMLPVMIERIVGPVSEFQLRELMAEFGYVNLHLKERPVYMSKIDMQTAQVSIEAQLPEFCTLVEMDPTVRGKLMHAALKERLALISIPNLTHDELVLAIRGGHFTFLFDAHGIFISEAPIPIQVEPPLASPK